MNVTTQQQRRGIYLLPNLFTTLSLFTAFYSIVASLQHRYETASIAIFIGMIADSLDGRVARLTNTQTEFGAQYDSLADMVAFGVAPSLVAYSWALSYVGKSGWLVAFFYTASVALRLARFNTQMATTDKRYFIGLPCPASAGVVASIIWFSTSQSFPIKVLAWPMAVMMFVLAGLMVSNLRFHSFKEVDFKGKVPFRYILWMVFIFVSLAAYPSLVLLISFMLYSFLGPIMTLKRQWQLRQKIKEAKKQKKNRSVAKKAKAKSTKE